MIPVGAVAVIGSPGGSLVTHRVAAVVRDDAGALVGYRTRGDALAVVDAGSVTPDEIVGVVAGGVPVFGALRAWMVSPLGIAIGLVMAWAFAALRALLGDGARRASAAGRQAVASSTIRPTS